MASARASGRPVTMITLTADSPSLVFSPPPASRHRSTSLVVDRKFLGGSNMTLEERC